VLLSLGITATPPPAMLHTSAEPALPNQRGGAADGGAPALYPDAAPLVIGCDVDLDVLAAARDNARAARCAEQITWQRTDVAHLTPRVVADVARERGRDLPRSGLLVANPPYGERLAEGDLRAIYRDLAETCRRFEGWRVGLLVGNSFLEEVFQRVVGRPRIKKPLANANLRAYFYLYEL
jgi:23S rRNA G2445 N2-methylase RlmL